MKSDQRYLAAETLAIRRSRFLFGCMQADHHLQETLGFPNALRSNKLRVSAILVAKTSRPIFRGISEMSGALTLSLRLLDYVVRLH